MSAWLVQLNGSAAFQCMMYQQNTKLTQKISAFQFFKVLAWLTRLRRTRRPCEQQSGFQEKLCFVLLVINIINIRLNSAEF
jgi:hypothetical protein